MKEPITKSPSSRVATSSSFSTIVPTYSWPICRWSTSLWPRYGHRSEPRTHAAASLRTTSVGFTTRGVSTVSTTTSPGARMTTAFMVAGISRSVGVGVSVLMVGPLV